MNRTKKVNFIGLTLILMFFAVLSACGGDKAGNGNNDGGTELGDKDIEIPYVEWAGAEASTHVVKAVLEKAGYNVTTPQVGKGAMFSSIAQQDADAMTCAWLPNNAVNLWDEYGDDLVKLNKTIDKAPSGLTVPANMDIDSIEDLKDNKEIGEATDWTITGIEAGSGEMLQTEKAMEEYGLDRWKLQNSSDAAMTASVGKAIDNKKPIVATLWKPHFAFGKWDLKILKDPKNVYGDPDGIWTVSRKGLKKDSPAAYKILKQFDWNYDFMNEVMVNIQDGTDPEKAGEEFVEEHKDLVKEWMDGV